MQWLKQSTAYTFQLGPFSDSVDAVTPETSLTIAATDVDVSQNGATYANKNDATALTGTGDSEGYYDCVLDATDTGTCGKLSVRCRVSGALPVWEHFMVVPAHVYDGLIAGTDNLQVDAVQILGTAIATPATAGLLDVNVKQISADATAADNAEAFFDGTGYAGTGNTIPTVTTITNGVTVTTNNDKTDYALSSAGVQAIWDALTSALTTVGSIGKWIVDKLDAAITTRGTGTALDEAGIRSAVGLNSANLDAQLDALPTAVENQSGMATSAQVDTLEQSMTDVKGATFDTATDSLEAIRNRGDAAWTTGEGGAGATDWTADERTAIKTILGVPASGTTPDAPSAGALKVIDDFLDTEIALLSVDLATAQSSLDALTAEKGGIVKNTSGSIAFPMEDTAGDLATGLTVTVKRSIDGGALATCAGTVTELSLGMYKFAYAAADTNGNNVTWVFSADGAKTLPFGFVTERPS